MPSATGTLRWSAIYNSPKRSTLQPPPSPLPGPSVPGTDIYIPMSPPPRGGMPQPMRPLILPSPPTSPSCLAGIDASYVATMRVQPDQQRLESPAMPPWHQPHLDTWPPPAEDVSHIRKLVVVPMFRFSDLENVQDSVIAQRYMVDRLDTPRATPYSITAMLNDPESPVLPAPPPMQPTWFGTSVTDHNEYDVDHEPNITPRDPLTTPVPTFASLPTLLSAAQHSTDIIINNFTPRHASPFPQIHCAPPSNPAITLIDATAQRQKQLSLGSCDMDISPPSPLPPTSIVSSASHPSEGPATTKSPPLPHAPSSKIASRYLLNANGNFVLDHQDLPCRKRSIENASTGMSVSPRTAIPPYCMLSRVVSLDTETDTEEKKQEEEKEAKGGCRGWWESSASGARRSIFTEEMEVSAPEGYFDRLDGGCA